MELYNEMKNNYIPAYQHMYVYGLLEIGCVYCVSVYDVSKIQELYHDKQTLICKTCGRQNVIPIISSSILVQDYTQQQRMTVLHSMNKDLFPNSKL